MDDNRQMRVQLFKTIKTVLTKKTKRKKKG